MSILASPFTSGSKTMPCPKSSHRRRNNSGELDVFEATRYFSGFTDVVVVVANPSVQADVVPSPSLYSASEPDKEDGQQKLIGARRSLDVPMTRARVTQNGAIARASWNYAANKEESPRTPSSPGGKIVSFLNSLFNQSASAEGTRKKKVKKTTAAARSLKEHDQISPGRWHRRRRSVGHIPTPGMVAESKSLKSTNRTAPTFSDANSDSRMPPPCAISKGPRNDTRSLSDHRQAAISVSIGNRAREEFAKWKVSCVEKEAKNLRMVVVDPYEEDDGNESDMSSDLFELPVYDSTGIDSIRRSSMSTDSSGSSFVKLHV